MHSAVVQNAECDGVSSGFSCRKSFVLPLDKHAFDQWTSKIQISHTYHVLNGITMIIMFIRIMVELSGKVSFFELLFAAITRARLELFNLSLIHICRCRRYAVCRSRWSPYH
eukprot:TRINITY_DN16658_c0_g2_i1.p2 TRINITY_DN16658_c0_g2~~TRINITY_DN16658_c0_g2_i1.p2  ORF type:complete len:112 (+),score=15.93 TRINITY_DN16658_c0_g2_i1:219-554(+)